MSTFARRLSFACIVACLAWAVAAPVQARESKSAEVFGPEAHPFGQSYEEWFGAYEVWLNEIPLSENPAVADSPKNCAPQDEKVVFVAGPSANCHLKERPRLPSADPSGSDLPRKDMERRSRNSVAAHARTGRRTSRQISSTSRSTSTVRGSYTAPLAVRHSGRGHRLSEREPL